MDGVPLPSAAQVPNPLLISVPEAWPQVAMVAGETSGDLLAGLLLDGMKTRWPAMQSRGIGGPHMAQRGFHALWPSEKLAVHGYSLEVLRRYREIVGIRRQLKGQCLGFKLNIYIQMCSSVWTRQTSISIWSAT